MTVEQAAMKLIEDFREIVKNVPNDAELGKAVRQIVKDIDDAQAYLDASTEEIDRILKGDESNN